MATKHFHMMITGGIEQGVVEKEKVIVWHCLMVELCVRQALSAVAGGCCCGIVEILGYHGKANVSVAQ